MANNPPTSLRMAFGYRQARASGIDGFEKEPSTGQMNFDLQWRDGEKEIRAIVEKYPSAGPIVRRMIKEQKARKRLSVDLILFELYGRGFRLPLKSK